MSGLGSTAGRRGWMMRLRMAYNDAVVTAAVTTSVLVSGGARTASTALCTKSISGAWVRWCVSWVACSPGRAITRSAGQGRIGRWFALAFVLSLASSVYTFENRLDGFPRESRTLRQNSEFDGVCFMRTSRRVRQQVHVRLGMAVMVAVPCWDLSSQQLRSGGHVGSNSALLQAMWPCLVT